MRSHRILAPRPRPPQNLRVASRSVSSRRWLRVVRSTSSIFPVKPFGIGHTTFLRHTSYRPLATVSAMTAGGAANHLPSMYTGT